MNFSGDALYEWNILGMHLSSAALWPGLRPSCPLSLACWANHNSTQHCLPLPPHVGFSGFQGLTRMVGEYTQKFKCSSLITQPAIFAVPCHIKYALRPNTWVAKITCPSLLNPTLPQPILSITFKDLACPAASEVKLFTPRGMPLYGAAMGCHCVQTYVW